MAEHIALKNLNSNRIWCRMTCGPSSDFVRRCRRSRDRVDVHPVAGVTASKFYDCGSGTVRQRAQRLVPRDFCWSRGERSNHRFHLKNPLSYRRLTFMMLDADVVPSVRRVFASVEAS